jgi:hypothetical protein
MPIPASQKLLLQEHPAFATISLGSAKFLGTLERITQIFK